MTPLTFWLLQLLVFVAAFMSGRTEAERRGEAGAPRAWLYALLAVTVSAVGSWLAQGIWPTVLVVLVARYLSVPRERRALWLGVLLVGMAVAVPLTLYLARR